MCIQLRKLDTGVVDERQVISQVVSLFAICVAFSQNVAKKVFQEALKGVLDDEAFKVPSAEAKMALCNIYILPIQKCWYWLDTDTNGCLHSLDWTTGLDYWTELFSFFGQVCVYFSANLEAFFKKITALQLPHTA